MALKSTYHELSKFGMVCKSLAPPTLQGVFLSIVGQKQLSLEFGIQKFK